jgi:hypothetical protein
MKRILQKFHHTKNKKTITVEGYDFNSKLQLVLN